jgi:hypothetical protein
MIYRMSVTPVSQRLLVPFSGEGSGVEELTWGQWDVWRMMELSGTPRMVGGVTTLAEGTTVRQVRQLLSFIVSRHQSLRTRIQTGADGAPKQVLASSGEVALEVADSAGDPAGAARSIQDRFRAGPFDLASDWPVRIAVVRHRGELTHFVAMYPHVVIDGYGFDALVSDLAKLDPLTGRHLGPHGGVQPLELARQQRDPAAQRQSAASLRYWEQALRSAPPRQFPGSVDRREPRYWEATYDSRAAQLAIVSLSRQLQLNTGPILMAAYAIALARVTGVSTRILRTQVSNRFRRGFADSVSALVQAGLCMVDTANASFAEVAKRAWRSQLAAGKHAYYDPRELWALLDRLTAELGFSPDPLCYINDRRRGASIPASAQTEPAYAEILAALPESTLTQGVRFSNRDTSAYLNVNGSAQTLNYTLRVDTHMLSPAQQEAILLGLEDILVTAAGDPSALMG